MLRGLITIAESETLMPTRNNHCRRDRWITFRFVSLGEGTYARSDVLRPVEWHKIVTRTHLRRRLTRSCEKPAKYQQKTDKDVGNNMGQYLKKLSNKKQWRSTRGQGRVQLKTPRQNLRWSLSQVGATTIGNSRRSAHPACL